MHTSTLQSVTDAFQAQDFRLPPTPYKLTQNVGQEGCWDRDVSNITEQASSTPRMRHLQPLNTKEKKRQGKLKQKQERQRERKRESISIPGPGMLNC
jgi:hypothetical protein